MRLENYIVHERPQVPPRLATDLSNLGVGALLHDIGKLSLPEEERFFKMTGQDGGTPEWRKHPEVGYEMVHGSLDPGAAQVILNHHQHFDGSGFPESKSQNYPGGEQKGLLEREIHIFCRITTAANRLDDFRYLADGEQVPMVVALKRMRNPGYTKWFDPEVLEVLEQSIPPFPPGQQATLNNGQLVVVTEVNDSAPCRPVVRPIDPDLATDTEAEKKLEETIKEGDIDLLVRTELYIEKVGDMDVSKYLY
jgi:HD-GYP domain-containing protein (c-di-GMP phosphodiesterase class II)